MHYNQSWMGYGIVGGLQAGLISALAALLLFVLFHALGRRNGWGGGLQIGWSFVAASVLTVSGDAWNLLYFGYARLQSLQLLKAKLALVHDPDSIGLRVLCELLGVALGIAIGWAVCHRGWSPRRDDPGR